MVRGGASDKHRNAGRSRVLKFAGSVTETGQAVIGIGLTSAEVQSLLNGDALFFNTEGMENIPSIELFVIIGETEEAMMQEMLRLGSLTAEKIQRQDDSAESQLRRAECDGKVN